MPDTATSARRAMLDIILTRAADRLGDITPLVYRRLDSRFPQAQATFDTLYPGGRGALQGEMVQQSLYCLMEWLSSPGEVEIVLLGTVPHHAETLAVPPDLFAGLLDAVVDTVAETIPADRPAERALWSEIRDDLCGLIGEAARHIRRPASPHTTATGLP